MKSKRLRVRIVPFPSSVRRRPAALGRCPGGRLRLATAATDASQRRAAAPPASSALDAVTVGTGAKGVPTVDAEGQAVSRSRRPTPQGPHRRATAPRSRPDDVVSADYLGAQRARTASSSTPATPQGSGHAWTSAAAGCHPGLGPRAWSARRSAAGSSWRCRRPTRSGPRATRRSAPVPPTRSLSLRRHQVGHRAADHRDRQGRGPQAPGCRPSTVTPGKPAVVTIPKTPAPKKLVVEPLVQGEGATVKAGQTRQGGLHRRRLRRRSDVRLLRRREGRPPRVPDRRPAGHPGLGQGPGRPEDRLARPHRRPARRGLRHQGQRRRPRSRAPTRWCSWSTSSAPAEPLPSPNERQRPMGFDPSTTKPEIDFPGDAAPTDLVIEDITPGDGTEAKAGRHGQRPLRRRRPTPPARSSTPRGTAARRSTSASASARSSRAGTRASSA